MKQTGRAALLVGTALMLLLPECCALSRTCCVEGRVVSAPERWRSYYDFLIDTGRGRKKISIKGAPSSPYNVLISEGRYVMISGVEKQALDGYVIELREEDVDIRVSLTR